MTPATPPAFGGALLLRSGVLRSGEYLRTTCSSIGSLKVICWPCNAAAEKRMSSRGVRQRILWQAPKNIIGQLLRAFNTLLTGALPGCFDQFLNCRSERNQQ